MNIVRLAYLLFYGMVGSYLPYLPLYLSSLGYQPAAIGTLVGMQGVSVLVMPLVAGFFSDTFHGAALLQKRIFAAGCMVFLVAISCSTSFLALALFSLLVGICMNPLFSLVDGWVMQQMKHRSYDVKGFARYRVWGSIGFIVPTILFGVFHTAIEGNYARLLQLGAVFGFLLFVFLLRRDLHLPKDAREATETAKRNPLSLAWRTYVAPQHLPLFFATFCIAVSMGVYYALFSIQLQSLALSPFLIGALYNVGVIAEVLFLFVIDRFMPRVAMTTGIFIAAAATAVRFLMLAVSDDMLVITLSQCLHAPIIWGMAVVSGMYISSIASVSNRYSLFSLHQMMQGGIARILGASVIPWIVGLCVADAHAMLSMTMLVASISGMLGAVLVKLKQERSY
jgi:PPP family 3-phenylpropionic acid transporter